MSHSLREIQTNLPWTIRYSQDFRLNPLTHKDFQHALIHVGKASGKLFELCDNCDHDRDVADSKELKEQYAKYIADLVFCALRMANTFPGGMIDLESELIHRIESKNGVKLFEEISHDLRKHLGYVYHLCNDDETKLWSFVILDPDSGDGIFISEYEFNSIDEADAEAKKKIIEIETR